MGYRLWPNDAGGSRTHLRLLVLTRQPNKAAVPVIAWLLSLFRPVPAILYP